MALEGELLTLYGQTDSSTTGNTFAMQADLTGAQSFKTLTLPQGTKAKIWAKRIGGAQVNLLIKFANDGSTWNTIGQEDLASAGELELEKRRPILLHAPTGSEVVRFDYTQAAAALSFVEVDIEIGADDDDY